MTAEMFSTLRGVAESSVAKRLGLPIDSLQNILNGYADSDFLKKFNLTEETAIMIRNEIGIQGLRGFILAKIL